MDKAMAKKAVNILNGLLDHIMDYEMVYDKIKDLEDDNLLARVECIITAVKALIKETESKYNV